MKRIMALSLIVIAGLAFAETKKIEKMNKSKAEWRETLTPEQYGVLCENGTERPFTGKLWNNKEKGMYVCAACKLPLFESAAKYDSGTGWPSFWQPKEKDHVIEQEDRSHGMLRTDLRCARCGGHLGHVFNDGPPPTGLRYCINSASLEFIKNPSK